MRLVSRLLAAALSWAVLCGETRAQGAADPDLVVRQVVLDIISFTRWPDPPAELRLCVVGAPARAAAFFAGDVTVGGVPVRARRVVLGDPRLGAGCDVVYEGPLDPAERYQLVLALAGHPVLTVGEAGPGCIERTMFCLEIGRVPVSFASNLDAIARSGVRLNPRVLLLGRGGNR